MFQDFTLFFELGWQHILDLDGYDHILFVVALCTLYTSKDWKKILILVTAFTIGHSITLALSTFDKLKISSSLIEFLIPLTIAATAMSNMVSKNRTPSFTSYNYSIALIFGLVHGLGFSNYLKSLLGKDTNVINQLLAFNIGLEFGQIIIIMVFMLITYLIIEVIKLPARKWSFVLSISILLIALVMASQRFESVIIEF